jgi:hypothetical protein
MKILGPSAQKFHEYQLRSQRFIHPKRATHFQLKKSIKLLFGVGQKNSLHFSSSTSSEQQYL